MNVKREEIEAWFNQLQNDICQQISLFDGTAFIEDNWTRAEGGGGRSRVLVGNTILAKAGVNFSAVHGKTPEKILQALKLEQADFYATGVSIVMHPVNPWCPIIHMNTRYFEMSNGVWWFGGGIDLTPHYIIPEQAAFFHRELKKVCDAFHPTYYIDFKKWADDYFFIPHRQETRGVGGIFFDHLKGDKELSPSKTFEFVKEVGKIFAPTYISLLQANKDKAYSEKERNWQMLRRGRYVEFNLVYDKGTKFGLDTNGRTESILMSLPPIANWEYNVQPEENSPEKYTLDHLKKELDWTSYQS
jgi:coproporphyrinogen III oxidase